MIKNGMLNPEIHAPLSRVRHGNTLAIADCGFPFRPEVETVDMSLADGVPTVLQVRRNSRNFAISLRKRMVMNSSKSQPR
jgi:D-ribose pyranose/furanose isomerase RbsD